MKKQFLSAVTILAMMFAATAIQPAIAAEMGGYVGFSLGTADDDVLNEDDSGYKVYGGFNSTDNLGFEVAYIDLGEYISGIREVDGLAFDVVGYFPVGKNVDIFGKAGLYAWTVNVGSLSDDGTDLTYGVGVNFGLANRLSVRAEWENFDDVSGNDISLISAGVTYHF